jgi:alpha-ketoglutarate-dependent taurine dioxygenase
MSEIKLNTPITFDLTDILEMNKLKDKVKQIVEQKLFTEGAIRFNTGILPDTAEFEALLAAMNASLKYYDYASTPRQVINNKVYTSTEYPADQEIKMHNEMAYSTAWPMRLWFYCETAARTGGQTPIADSREIYKKINPEIRERFERDGLIYIRNYRRELDLSWQDTFNTDDKQKVEAYCDKLNIQYQWHGDELTTKHKCQATAVHPETGEPVWFNQAHLFHISNLQPEYREALCSIYKVTEFPRNVVYGDGSPIEDSVLDEVRAVIMSEKRLFTWQDGDVMVLDNMLFSHGREPFKGDRRVAVAME